MEPANSVMPDPFRQAFSGAPWVGPVAYERGVSAGGLQQLFSGWLLSRLTSSWRAFLLHFPHFLGGV